MNRLILIGNGFDLAHDMKTSYNDFIKWYLKKCFNEAIKLRITNQGYSDELMDIYKLYNYEISIGDIDNVSDLIEHFYEVGFEGLLSGRKIKVPNYWNDYENPFKINIKSKLLKELLTKCSGSNWVDIENEFYFLLKSLLPTTNDHDDSKLKQSESLNKSLKHLIEQLEEYLKGLDLTRLIHGYTTIFSSPIYKREICTKKIEVNEEVKTTLILNFNYTETPKKYLADELADVKINYIHGRISDNSNPLIFGFGDELDSNYNALELQRVNAFFTYIKSFWYFKTHHYHDLIRFIQADDFQVYVLGHSCGLSDRTMLNMIFEHKNCVSIKIFYHVDKNGNNNYTDLTYEISRHFKDKTAMREKIVSKDYSEPMPQANPR